MQSIDWIFTLASVLLVLGIALYTRRYVRSVADFLAGGRCAGRYLIANARGESASGITNSISYFEIFALAGFTYNFWDTFRVPVLVLVGITGFVVYRFRETRALTLAQFFEMRYSRGFRLFMGALAFLSGILNYAIFPAVSSRFLVYFIGLPETIHPLGANIPTFAAIMAAYLPCTLIMLMLGGQVTLMVTDCVAGLLSHAILIVVLVVCFTQVHWPQVVQVLASQPAGHSMLNPLDSWSVSDFNIWYVIMNVILLTYGTMALQNSQGYNAAARDAHESRMGGILYNWRLYVRIIMLMTVAVAAVTFMRHPDFMSVAGPAHAVVSGISDTEVQKQMSIPVALRFMLPPGLKGLFCAVMVMGLLAGDCGHIHSWGSIFIQDVILPLQKRQMSTRKHLWVLRFSMIGVALFGFLFSVFFTPSHYIALWWQITNAIFISGAGAAIIGGLYWKRGTTPAAFAAVIAGAILSLTGIFFTQRWPKTFPLNGIEVFFLAAVAASILYVLISVLMPAHSVDLRALLHRGHHPPKPQPPFLERLLGFDSDFTKRDKWVAGSLLGWSLLLALINLGICMVLHWPGSIHFWSSYCFIFGVGLPLVLAIITLIWFGIGGIIDLIDLFRLLRTVRRDPHDDGRVPIQK